MVPVVTELRKFYVKRVLTTLTIASFLAMLACIQLSTNVIKPVPAELKTRNHTEHILPTQCKRLTTRRHKSNAEVKRPPWFDLMSASTSLSNPMSASNSTETQRVTYIVTQGNYGRLGNQMFLYASLFGIAWRNSRMIPLWQDDRYGLRQIFKNIRIDADHTSPFRNVSLLLI